ncbi:hypothetical protein BABINDRAFT_7930 [Babjeviella inositovora NRRL Y-12698]|uniref:26S proteasome regulatory subunit RPN2 n=1 Tax=Babjeviella inositovora NRRL Y-12698 TaxID=984486 RepID=A0A1E3QRZ9_9ASCO|nr:uncharacterized protein BABINDRAFT_7930 [Babjeviella inositovora NRRL Y-12698]ODQ79717.1 hypothetical protein BABINDRAFT_7930 [Babjeviella inositovora NRRL Y-12698]
MALTSAAPYLALLSEADESLKTYALTSLNEVVDQLWAEVANEITAIEELYESESYAHRHLAALLASKVYYNLGDFDAAVKYALAAGNQFDIDEQSQYVETIISKCINRYIAQSQKFVQAPSGPAPSPELTFVFERMLQKCVQTGELKLAVGIALESYRLDIVADILAKADDAMDLVSYVLVIATTVLDNAAVRTQTLRALVALVLGMAAPDYFVATKLIIQLNDAALAAQLFTDLHTKADHLTALQSAFDLVSSASQELLYKTLAALQANEPLATDRDFARVLRVLTGVPTCDLDVTFLANNNNTDVSILNKAKAALDGRNSIYHSAVSFQTAFMYAGTTDDSFLRANLEWLGKATNWSKFLATAALGVIHKGNLAQGRTILQPYLPGNSGSHFTKGGSLYALGLIYAGHGRETIDYLKKHLIEDGNSAGNDEVDVILHGAALGVGVAGMASGNEELYEVLKTVLYSDSAVAGQAAGLAMGLVMLGSGNETAIDDMFQYAQETQHETIIRGLAIGIALLNYAKEDTAKTTIDKLLEHQNPILRYGGAFTVALAYCGTGNNAAIKRLLHVAVSDSSDDVRRAAVIALGFVLLRDYTTVPTIVELLSESHNPHVRYGTAMALGISCAGRGLPAAIEVLEPLSKDPVDFVRQGALVAMSMILIQENEKTFPKVAEIRKQFAGVIASKSQDALAKFGASLAQGIIDAGGRNVTIQLENTQTNTLNMKAIVGLTVFTQTWYWFPLTHFLSLSFTPTSITGVREDLRVPKFQINCHTKADIFGYPPKVADAKEKAPEKIVTAVLSTSARANARAKKAKAEKEKDDMDVDTPKEEAPEPPVDEAKVEEGEEEVPEEVETEDASTRYTKTPYKIDNMTRVVPSQLKYISFKDERFVPVRKFRGTGGVVILKDNAPGEPAEFIKTIRQLSNTEAPVPEPFTLSEEDAE